ncbi:U32 family peptidase C-terminal domain-containing protein [Candidatus Falkowbacteria bacterium]|nr:U32 family peptidase C-terminal domain-containing protein [Candidatus Falkowbacteria bacterium]
MELLAPAGNFSKMKYAIEYGADSVYLGLPSLSLRARINDFTPLKLEEAIKYCHDHNKKIYVTVNIYAHNHHLKSIEQNLKLLNKLKPDAVIISDPGIIMLAKKHLKGIDLHLSTQANCTNWQAAQFWHKQGIKRIILARELNLKEINEIHKKVPQLELEGFGHGAMCMAYSGRCILSSYLANRSANLGDCSHPCRWSYKLHLEEETRPGEFMPIEEDQHGTYILSSKDICMIKYLKEMERAGIKHFKIEGRTKSIAYLANAVKIYRQALDNMNNKSLTDNLYKELQKISNRDFTTGFYFDTEKVKMQNYNKTHFRSESEFCGEVIESKKNNKKAWQAKIKVHNVIRSGETIEFIRPLQDNFTEKIKEIFDLDKKKNVKEVHGGQGKAILVKLNKEVPVMTILRKKI